MTMTKAEATAPAKVPTKAEILEKLKQNDAKLPNTEQPIFELAQLNRSGFYWQFIGLCEQAEALANADSPPDIKQALICLFENLVCLEMRINAAKENAEQAKAEGIRKLKAELEHAKEVAGQYIDVNKVLIMPLSSESLLNDPDEWTLAEITAAVCRDIETIRCHQWEAIGKKIAKDFADQRPEQFPDADSRNELMQMIKAISVDMKNGFGTMQSAIQDHHIQTTDDHRRQDADNTDIKKMVKTGKPPMNKVALAKLWGVTRQTIDNWCKPKGKPKEWPGIRADNDTMRRAADKYKARRTITKLDRANKGKLGYIEGETEKYTK
jgi:hypothetical protein